MLNLRFEHKMSRVFLLICFLGISSVVQADAESRHQPPWFCHGLDCPEYKVIKQGDGYETREYGGGKFVATTIETYAYAMASTVGFRRLFNYIEGENEDNVKIPMTAPVVTRVNASSGPFCKSEFTVAFFVPFDFQDDTPVPTNKDVFVHEVPPFTAYVASSGGFVVDDWSIQKMAKKLTEAVDADGESYRTDVFFFAGYDPPFRLSGRHNEVWLVASDTQQNVAVA